MPHTLLPPIAADTPTLFPSAPEANDSPWLSWVPTADYWKAAPTMLLPPPPRAFPVPIPEGIRLIPTDLLPPPLLDLPLKAPSAIPPPRLLAITPPPLAKVAAAPDILPEPEPVPAPAPLPLDDFPLERCAAMEGSIALHPEKAADILNAAHLDGETWSALRIYWNKALRDALAQGDPSLLRRHDTAFVAAIEATRGPFSGGNFARIILAAERGQGSFEADRLRIASQALLPIRRVMSARAFNEPSTKADLRAGLGASPSRRGT